MDFNEPITPSLERRVLQTIITICESYLEQYPTNLAQDEQLMSDRVLFKALTRQQRMAVKLRASEKRILLQTINAVQDELAKLPQVVSSRGEMVAAGRSFDVVGKARAEISANAGTLGAFVDIRDEPKKASKKDGAVPSPGLADEDGAAVEVSEGSKLPSVAERRRRRRTNSNSDNNGN